MELPSTARILFEHLRPEDVRRHEIGSELDATELDIDGLRQRLQQLRLAQPGHAFEQRVAFAQQADQDRPHEVVLTDDHPADLILDLTRDVRVPFRAHWNRAVAGHPVLSAIRWKYALTSARTDGGICI